MYTALRCYFPPFQPTQSSSKKNLSSVPRIGTAKGLDAEIEDVWFLCAELNLGAKVRKTNQQHHIRRKTAVTFRDLFWGWRRFIRDPEISKGCFFCDENPPGPCDTV